MSDKKVLVTDYTWPSTAPEAEVLAKFGATLIEAKTGKEDELVELVKDADAILTCFAKVTAKVIRSGPKLQVVGRYGIGVDNIAVDEATAREIPVTNVPVYCTDEVAEHTMAMLLACARGIGRYNTAIRRNNWSLKEAMPLFRVSGRTLGLIGFGKIGRAVATRAVGMGLRVIAHSLPIDAEAIRSSGAEPVEMEELLAESDFVSLHVPLIDETRNTMNETRLRAMKPTAFLVNCSRGGLVDTDALVKALQEKWIAGAALDVFEPEPLPEGHPLIDCENLIATPHAAFYSENSVYELETKAATNVGKILTGRLPDHCVNPHVLKLPRWSHLE